MKSNESKFNKLSKEDVVQQLIHLDRIVHSLFKQLGVYTFTGAVIKISELESMASIARIIRAEFPNIDNVPIDSEGTVLLFVDGSYLKDLFKIVDEMEN